tara:strand:+ start:461 stop:691 length:231 start_codon:yes stop_codon:yes gene_type:complete
LNVFVSIPGKGKLKCVRRNNIKDVITLNIIVVPMLRNVDETIAGIISKNENGFRIPPVKYKRTLNCTKSYRRKNEA